MRPESASGFVSKDPTRLHDLSLGGPPPAAAAPSSPASPPKAPSAVRDPLAPPNLVQNRNVANKEKAMETARKMDNMIQSSANKFFALASPC